MESTGLGSGSVASRFVSETQLSEAQKRREEDIRAAYARMGQSPPPEALQSQEEYDPRTLYEKLKAKSDAKQEAFEEKIKLSNQFRGIDDAESEFLAEVARERKEEQRKREEETKRELEEFRKASLSKEALPQGPVGSIASVPQTASTLDVAKSTVAPAKSKGKRKREGLLGVVKKKPSISNPSGKEVIANGKGLKSVNSGDSEEMGQKG